MSELKQLLHGCRDKYRQFLLYRIAGISKEEALQLTGITLPHYKKLRQEKEYFRYIVDNIAELQADYRDEAVRMLRRSTQTTAMLMEQKIMDTLYEEVTSGEYKLLKTQLGREVYSKLMTDLEKKEEAPTVDYKQLILNITQEQLGDGSQVAPLLPFNPSKPQNND